MIIYYKKKRIYKYTLHDGVEFETGIKSELSFDTQFLSIDEAGKLVIINGYSWDGPSGPTIDTKTFMRGSLIHDALYQLIREGVLPLTTRKQADKILRSTCIDDGMAMFRAWYVYRAVRMLGGRSVKSDLKRAP